MSDRDIALQLADYLARQREREYHDDSPAQIEPVVLQHIAKLAQWEKLVREIAEELE